MSAMRTPRAPGEVCGVNVILLGDGREIHLDGIDTAEAGQAILDDVDASIDRIEIQISNADGGLSPNDPDWRRRAGIALKRKRRQRPRLQQRIGDLRRAARGVYRPRTTIAIVAATVVAIMEEEADAIWIMRTLAEAELAPITAAHIRALQHLITSEEFDGLDRETLARTIQALPVVAAMQEAKEHGAVHCVPAWRGLAAVWFKATKKRPRRGDAPPVPETKDGPIALVEPIRAAGIKRDDRPARGGWKSGNHTRRCRHCDERFIGNGQAFTCADCAYSGPPASQAPNP